MGIEEVLLFLFLFFSAFFSASETALTSLSYTTLEHLFKRYKTLGLWISHPIKVLITILIGNNLVNIFAASLATILAKKHFQNIGIAVVAGSMTLIIITVGEIFPKTFAKRYNEKIAPFLMPLINLFYYTFYPLTMVFYYLTKVGLKKGDIGFKERDLIYAIDISSKKGLLPGMGAKMLYSILKLKDLKVKDIMIPKINVSYASVEEDRENLLKIFMDTGYSRIPIYEGNEDNIIGILHAKELFKDYKDFKNILKPPIFAPEYQKAFSLLEEMRRKKIHMACVVDEYGIFTGIVTIEDILEEIVGEIEDEYDRKVEKFKKIREGEYIFSADMPLSEIENVIQAKFPKSSNYNSLRGFIFYNWDKVVKKGEKYFWEGFEFEILEESGKKNLKIKVKKI